MEGTVIPRDHEDYPPHLSALLGAEAPAAISVAGDLALLRSRKLALFVSVKCPGTMILQTYDFVQRLRGYELAFVSGFHSPMEKECLRTLAGGTCGIIWCLAKALASFNMPADFEAVFEASRMLVLSPFPDSATRMTKETARYRNHVAAALADEVFIPYAGPGGGTEKFCLEVLSWEKPVFTLDAAEDAGIIERGAQPVAVQDIPSMWSA